MGIQAEFLKEQQYNDPFLSKFVKIVEQNLQEDWNSAKLADLLSMSESNIRRKIKALTDMSPSIFIRRLRLKIAYQLIHSTDLPIQQIAYQVGFQSPAHFSRYFKEVFKQSPSSLRK